MAARIALPDLSISTQVHSAGIGLINIFALDLFEFIDRGLKKSKGQNWLTEMQVQSVGGDVNFKDPSALLKEILHKGQSPLRAPISALVPKSNWKDFYKRLEDLLGERHLWIHNSIKTDGEQLKSLVLLVNKVSWSLELPVVQECQELLDLINPDENSVPVEISEPIAEPSEIAAELSKFTSENETLVGSPLAGPFISHSYTLHLNGSVRDRHSDELLEDLIPAGETLGALLVARKPSGGRLRITADGDIAAYFGEDWGFLAKVTPETWFPGHLRD